MSERCTSRVTLRRSSAVVAVVGLVASFSVGCSSSDETNAVAAQTVAAPATVTDACSESHAGHSAMMWTPAMADEMTDAGCGWPSGFFIVELTGGADDPDLNATFEARRYSELWAAMGTADLGLCSVGTETQATADSGVGRAFGFVYRLAQLGCPGAIPTGTLRVNEYGTEAQRDAAANTSAATVPTYVLGRWVIRLEGDAGVLETQVVSLGGQSLA